MKSAPTKVFFTLTAAEGLFMVAWYFLLPSEATNAFLFGLSKARLALVLVTALVWLVVTGATLVIWKSQIWLDRLHHAVDQLLADRKDVLPATIFTFVMALIGLLIIIAVTSINHTDYNAIGSLTDRFGVE
ncbi:MAG TPA: hypothetical protein VHO48_15260, partial [Anaerolineaceae bacterium]|nr:hypothetical protein [Anaerolineaceae bacterium]